MLKYIKQYADSIQGVSIYPIISLFIFVLFFIAVLYYVKKIDKRQVEEIRNLPLDLDNDNYSFVNTINQA